MDFIEPKYYIKISDKYIGSSFPVIGKCYLPSTALINCIEKIEIYRKRPGIYKL